MTTTLRTTSSGAVAELAVDGLSLVLYPSTELEAGPANLWLRRRGTDGVEQVRPLTGPASGGLAHGPDGRVAVEGEWDGLRHRAWFDLADDVTGWRWEVANLGDQPCTVDVVCTLDVALTPFDDLRRSEAYVSQYLDLAPVEVDGTTAVAVRQNMPGERQPWLALGSTRPVAGWCTDALQLRDEHTRVGLDLSRDLPSARLQHEHTLAGLQTVATTLAPGERCEGTFWIVVTADHPAATGPADADLLRSRLAGRTWAGWTATGPGRPVAASVFCPAAVAEALPEPAGLDDEGLRLVERSDEGLLSAYRGEGAGAVHLVTGRKERRVLRPHGELMHHSPGAEADGDALASTAWMAGAFASQLTHGPASSGERLSVVRSYLGLNLASGVRLLVRRPDGPWHLLAVPSLWEVSVDGVRWTYELAGALAGSTVHVTAALVGTRAVDLAVHTSGGPLEALLCLFTDHDGVTVTGAGPVGDDAVLFADHVSRQPGVLTVPLAAGDAVTVRLGVGGGHDGAPHAWSVPTLAGDDPEVGMVSQWLHHLAHDAAVHYQAPRGLEQYTGGAWGVRDVCQGPVGLLMATDELPALRRTLVQVFAGQQDDGDWPQWFHFLDELRFTGHRESHGDVVYWPLLALAEYLVATGDDSLLDEQVPFVAVDGFTAPASLREHVTRAVDRLASRRTRDERLPAYGHGDWNDSLQPARPELAQQMCSTWTTELEVQAAEALARAAAVSWPAMAERLTGLAARTREAFDEVLLADGELAGYAVVDDGVELLVHPRDVRTGLRHGSLQMIHAISGELLSRQDARAHRELVREHLAAPSGTYLFAEPVTYSGGVMTVFKRAEAATFWGREIGLMYTHAHLRFVEALTVLGEGDEAWAELMKVVPLGLGERHPGARPRQVNCYYSSSDTAFADRYEASARAADLFDPETPCEGGWRVYSSGPGLVLRIVRDRVLGLRPTRDGLEVDPVLATALDGLRAEVRIDGTTVGVTYVRGEQGCGVRQVRCGGRELPTRPLAARYREAGVRLEVDLASLATGGRVELEVVTG